MISRVAETCFWLGRQVERSENLARLLSVNQSFVLDVELDPPQRWQPVMV
ncbi:MAG: alpha-E domain-containing protein, partial [Myxococcales bacterium]|nr:alpha-E domain-containing protein [Myxococcales bacterium]